MTHCLCNRLHASRAVEVKERDRYITADNAPILPKRHQTVVLQRSPFYAGLCALKLLPEWSRGIFIIVIIILESGRRVLWFDFFLFKLVHNYTRLSSTFPLLEVLKVGGRAQVDGRPPADPMSPPRRQRSEAQVWEPAVGKAASCSFILLLTLCFQLNAQRKLSQLSAQRCSV